MNNIDKKYIKCNQDRFEILTNYNDVGRWANENTNDTESNIVHGSYLR